MKRKFLLCGFALALAGASALAQGIAKIHGHVLNPAGVPETSGTVGLSTDGGATSKYTFPVGPDGSFTGDHIAPGTYTITFRLPETPKDKVVDQIDDIKLDAGDDKAEDVDMSRPAYIKKMSPEEQRQLEEYKKKAAGIMKSNAVIKQVNADIQTANAEFKANQFAEVEAMMKKDTELKPDASILWLDLGKAQVSLKEYDDALPNLQKAIDTEAAIADAKKKNAAITAEAYYQKGAALVHLGKLPEAQAAIDAAAAAYAPSAGMYYSNEAALFFNLGKTDEQLAAADKAIAADPTRAINYYLKGQSLVGKGTEDPKTHKLVFPPGCLESYQKYIDLDPNGRYVAEVKEILVAAGQTIQTVYRKK